MVFVTYTMTSVCVYECDVQGYEAEPEFSECLHTSVVKPYLYCKLISSSLNLGVHSVYFVGH